MKYELVIFDMDGTILDTLEDLAGSLNYSLETAGFLPRTLSEVRSFVGNGILRLIERAVPEGTSAEQTAALFDVFAAHYKLHCADKTKPYDGIKPLIARLRENGIRTAVVSNKADFAVRALCDDYFAGLFDAAVGEREGVRKKPFPDSVNEVIKKLEIPRERALYIGDSEVDIETAKNAEIDCVSVDWGFRDRAVLEKSGASLILSDADSLERYILR